MHRQKSYQLIHEHLMDAMCDLVGVRRGSPNDVINGAVTDANRAEFERLNKLNDEAVTQTERAKYP